MIKKWIVMIILISILFIGSIFETKFINKSLNSLINSLETLQIEIMENKDKIDSEELITHAYDIHEKWHKKVNILKCLVWHTSIKDIETSFAKIAVFIGENEYSDAYSEIASLIDYLAHYLDDFKVSIENIF